MMRDIIDSIHSVAKTFFIEQSEFVASHHGDEDILVRRLYNSTTPLYVDILTALNDLEPKYGEEDLKFLIRKFAESLASIDEADTELQRSFFYNAFDQFLKDIGNVIHTGMLARQKERPGKQISFVPIQNEPVFELR